MFGHEDMNSAGTATDLEILTDCHHESNANDGLEFSKIFQNVSHCHLIYLTRCVSGSETAFLNYN